MTKRLLKLVSIACAAVSTLNVWNTYCAYINYPDVEKTFTDVLVIFWHTLSVLLVISLLHQSFFK